jgi:uncharacterized membrane protein YgcG
MNNKYFLYAVFVTVISTWTSWSRLMASPTSSGGSGGGSSWSSHSSGGGGYSGGGHK